MGQIDTVAINPTYINAALTGFIFRVDLSAPKFSTLRTNLGIGGSLRVTLADGTTEIPAWWSQDDGVLYCILDVSPTVDTEIKIYSGNAFSDYATTDPLGRNAVFSDFVAFWPLHQTPNLGALNVAGDTVFDLPEEGSFLISDTVAAPFGGGTAPMFGWSTSKIMIKRSANPTLPSQVTTGAIYQTPYGTDVEGTLIQISNYTSTEIIRLAEVYNKFGGHRVEARSAGGGNANTVNQLHGTTLGWQSAFGVHEVRQATAQHNQTEASSAVGGVDVLPAGFDYISIGGEGYSSGGRQSFKDDDENWDRGAISDAFIYNGVLSKAYRDAMHDNIFTGAFYSVTGTTGDFPDGGGDVTGTGSALAGTITGSGTGTVAPADGTGAAILGGIAASGSGGVMQASAGGASTGAVTASGAGNVGITGAGAANISPMYGGGIGTVEGGARSGSGAANVPSMVASGIGLVGKIGTGAASTGAITAAGAGGVTQTSTGSATNAAITASGLGYVDGITGTGAASLGAIAASGAGYTNTPATIGYESVLWYHTGASADGETQREQASSLGNYRSGTEIRSITWDTTDPMIGIEILSMSGFNGTGLGSLNAVTDDSVIWIPPAGQGGATVTILNGEEQVVFGKNGAWIRIKRVSGLPLAGAHTVRCIDIFNNAIGFDNVPSADAVAGETYYRAIIGKNNTIGNVLTGKVWLDSTTDGDIAIAYEVLSGDKIQTIANETTAPTGLTWNTGVTPDLGLQLPPLPAGGSIGIWFRRTIPADTLPSGSQLVYVHSEYTDGVATYNGAIRGRYRIIRDDYVTEGVWVGQNAEPDFSLPANELFTSRPHTTSLSLATGNTYHCIIRKRNKFGLWSQNTESTKLILNAAGGTDPTPPTAPITQLITQNSSNEAIVSARYEPSLDGANKAEVFAIWHTTDNTTPSTSGVPTAYQQMDGKLGIEILKYTYDGTALLDGTPVKAIIRTRRVVVGLGTAFSPDTTQLPASGGGTIVVASEITGWPSTGYAKVTDAGKLLEVFNYSSLVVGSGISTFTVGAFGRAQWGTTENATTVNTVVSPVTSQDSTNTDVVEYIMDALAPGRAWGDILFGHKGVQEQTPIAGPDGVTKDYVDVPNNIYLLLGEGWVEFWMDITLVWKCFYDGNAPSAQRLYVPSGWDLITGTITGATAGSTVLEATSATDVYIVSRNMRKAHIDSSAMTITAEDFYAIGGLPETAPQSTTWEQYAGSLLQVWDTEKTDYRPHIQLTQTGEFKSETTIDITLSQAQIVAL